MNEALALGEKFKGTSKNSIVKISDILMEYIFLKNVNAKKKMYDE